MCYVQNSIMELLITDLIAAFAEIYGTLPLPPDDVGIEIYFTIGSQPGIASIYSHIASGTAKSLLSSI